jgi:hypothetical protein
LDWRGLHETITIDAPEHIFLETHIIEILCLFFPVRDEFFVSL